MLLSKGFGKRCVGCALPHRENTRCCAACLAELPWLTTTCRGCALPLPATHTHCPSCLKRPLLEIPIDALFAYQAPIDRFIIQLKFHQSLSYAGLLGELLVHYCATHYRHKPKPQAIIAMPLHGRRLRRRGYNQTLEIARPLHHHWQVPLIHRGIIRQRYAAPQSASSKQQRARNVRTAFTIETELPERVTVIDDVLTTGQTLTSFIAALQKAGAKSIEAVIIARATADTLLY